MTDHGPRRQGMEQGAAAALASAGTILVGVSLRHVDRKASIALVGGGAAILLAAVVVRPGHPWLHDPVLRFSSGLAGLLLIGAALWLIASERRRRDATA